MIRKAEIDTLPRCQKIFEHPLYKKHFGNLQKLEADRIFCRHTFEHFMDVARIAYIMNLEKGLGISREIIYATALLHDIGRDEQYENGTPHDKASADISRCILPECGFNDDEIDLIIVAIMSHRGSGKLSDKMTLSEIIYIADKASRQCFMCKAQDECNWSMDKRNLEINI
ncbi:uncharacterized protein SAMN02745229_01949 [Butyrivibrio fibrisolvens DSM 3071]|uniref:HD domain-containing protein n=1 Tax=Butyrivibrio fibrisolvens DSM 3071 TaxID=1121131 RepID=A0A1M5Z2Y8_BUTFI|nr:HD domain-containing protein [Butyrivibrio fibrisolvens]SHI18626.1 uncharacterized protein SAMN02745229_01949 [Butyrivibrio fibrisolvens DSM 3071]